MRFLILAWMLQLFLGCQTAVTPSTPRPGPQGAVRKVFIQGEWYGTAWHLSGEYWITADHICEDYIDSATLGTDPAALVKRGMYLNGGDDLCVLRGPAIGPSLPLGPEPEFGDRLTFIGFPEGHFGAFEGLYSGVDEVTGEPMFSTSGGYGGASGSPVLNARGEVVGVLVSSYRGRPYVYFEPTSDLRRLLLSLATPAFP